MGRRQNAAGAVDESAPVGPAMRRTFRSRAAAPPKRRVAYNRHVQRDRQQRYYESRKLHAKYRRLQRFESRMESGNSAVGSSLSARIASGDAGALDEEYERSLALSFGEVAAPTRNRRLLRKRRGAAAIITQVQAEAPSAEHESIGTLPGSAPVDESRRGLEATVDPGTKLSGPLKRKRKLSGAASAKLADSSGGAGHKKPAVPNRYAKDLRQFQQKAEAERTEREQREEEQRQRNKRRREFARERAVKGQRLRQRTARGQPRMQNLLADLTSKLMPAKGA